MTTDHFCFYLQNRVIQTSQTGGQQYSDTSLFSTPWFNLLSLPDQDVFLLNSLYQVSVSSNFLLRQWCSSPVPGEPFQPSRNILMGLQHRDKTRAHTLCCFCLFSSSFEHAKNLLIMAPDSTKNSSKSVIFSYTIMNNIVRILLLL